MTLEEYVFDLGSGGIALTAQLRLAELLKQDGYRVVKLERAYSLSGELYRTTEELT